MKISKIRTKNELAKFLKKKGEAGVTAVVEELKSIEDLFNQNLETKRVIDENQNLLKINKNSLRVWVGEYMSENGYNKLSSEDFSITCRKQRDITTVTQNPSVKYNGTWTNVDNLEKTALVKMIDELGGRVIFRQKSETKTKSAEIVITEK